MFDIALGWRLALPPRCQLLRNKLKSRKRPEDKSRDKSPDRAVEKRTVRRKKVKKTVPEFSCRLYSRRLNGFLSEKTDVTNGKVKLVVRKPLFPRLEGLSISRNSDEDEIQIRRLPEKQTLDSFDLGTISALYDIPWRFEDVSMDSSSEEEFRPEKEVFESVASKCVKDQAIYREKNWKFYFSLVDKRKVRLDAIEWQATK